jgi:L-alanine-DL-glutamate epimerase-like enolase superfamily enzyme
VSNWGATWRYLVADSQLRWIGPEKGVIHLALGAVVNALWDLWAKTLNKPVWQIVADMTPEEVVALIDFRYIEDALTKEEALELLKKAEVGKKSRMQEAFDDKAVRAYTTSAGWIGYDQEKMERLLRETLEAGYKHFKLKVGISVESDRERLTIARKVIGYDKGNILMVDANQVSHWCSIQVIKVANVGRKGVVCSRSNRVDEQARRLQTVVHRRTNIARRCARPRCHSQGSETTWYWCGNRRDVSKPRHVQAVPAS